MVLKVTSRILRNSCRYYTKRHHMVLPADTFEGKIIPKTRLINKESRGPVKYGGKYIVTMLPGRFTNLLMVDLLK